MPETVYQLKVTLKHSKPPIWRRIQVRGGTTLERLHWIIQAAMGWGNEHLWVFDIRGLRYTDEEWAPDNADEAARNVTVDELGLEAGARFLYTYDFGDNWKHVVEVEKILAPVSGVHYPRCVKARRACPPEDIGGVWGYEALLEALKDPTPPRGRGRRSAIVGRQGLRSGGG